MLPPKARYILWLDPGDTTGWCLYDREANLPLVEELDEWTALCSKLERWLTGTGGPKTVVGVERYVITAQSHRRDPTAIAVQVYGMARWLAWRHGAAGFMGRQRSTDALSLVTDDWLRRIGWYRLGMPHGNDASRHVIKFMEDEGVLPAKLRAGVLPA